MADNTSNPYGMLGSKKNLDSFLSAVSKSQSSSSGSSSRSRSSNVADNPLVFDTPAYQRQFGQTTPKLGSSAKSALEKQIASFSSNNADYKALAEAFSQSLDAQKQIAESYNKPEIPLQPTPTADMTAWDSFAKSIADTTALNTAYTQQAQQQQQAIIEMQQEKQRMADAFDLPSKYEDLLDQAGIPKMNKQLQQANLKMTQMQSQYERDMLAIEGQAIPKPFVVGAQTERQKLAAIELGAQAAYVQALQGNIELANHYVDKMIDFEITDYNAKYQAMTDNITLATKFLDNTLAKEAQQIQFQLDMQKAEKTAFLSMKGDIVKTMLDNGASGAALQEAMTSGDYGSLTSVASPYLSGTGGAPKIININGEAMVWDATTGTFVPAPVSGSSDTLAQAQREGKISETSELIKSKGLDSAVGTTIYSRGAGGFKGVVGRFLAGAATGGIAGAAGGSLFAGVGAIPGAVIGSVVGGVTMASQGVKDTITGDRQDFIAGVEQLRQQLTLDKLIEAKSSGATFGALSDSEKQTLSEAATRIGNWAVKDGDSVIGYNTSEKSMRKEIDLINNYAKLDAILKGSSPESVGVVIMGDGSYWAQNSDGSLTKIR